MRTDDKPLIVIAGETLGLGGAEKVTVDLANALHESDAYRVHLITTLAPGGLYAGQVAEGIGVSHAPTREEFVAEIARLRPDGLLLNNCRLAKGCIDRILDAHRPSYLGFFLHGFSTYSMDLLPATLPEGAEVLTISSEAKRGILKQRPDIARSAVSVLSNAVDVHRFRPLADGQEPWVPIFERGAGPVFGYTGRFSGEKALVTMVDVFQRVRRTLTDARLLLVGGADPGVPVHEGYWNAERQAVEQAIRQMGLTDAVHITGAVANPEDFYPAMDVFLLTSLFEGVPLVLLEAMACAVPAVCTAVGAVPRLLRNGAGVAIARKGFDLDEAERELFASKMVEVATSPRRREMGVTGRGIVVKQHSMTRYRRDAVAYFDARLGQQEG
jgi:glycosyltransferase involved in cell wall biosynthesis